MSEDVPGDGQVRGRLSLEKRFIAFSGEVDTGSREENASKQKARARF
jgi:hypothetical protein